MKKVLLILGVVLVVLCGGGYYGYKMMAAAKAAATAPVGATAEVKKGDLLQEVVETGTIDAVKSVEVKSRASGRLSKLFVDEGDIVHTGQLIAIIDPQETQLQVRQAQAQLRGAQSSVTRTNIEIAQRRISAQADLKQAQIRVVQLQAELGIQPTLTNAAIRTAQSQVDSAKQELERLDKTAHPNQRIATETALREATANQSNVQAEYNRQKELLSQGYVSAKVVENAGLNLELANVRLRQAQENSDRLETQLRIERQRAQESLTQAQASLSQAQANTIQNVLKRKDYENAVATLAKARASLRDVETLTQSKIQSQSTVDQLSNALKDSERQLHETEIRSTLNGVVTKKLVQEGELVASLSSFSSGTPILRIEDRTALRVMLSINEIDTAKLTLGMKAKVTVDAIPNHEFTGSVKKVAPASTAVGQTAVGTQVSTDSVVKYQVEIWLDGVDNRLRSGMSARCTLEVAKRNQVLVLPTEFIAKDIKGHYVELPPTSKEKGAKPEKKYITTGLETGASIEILSGLKEGDKVQRPAFSGPPRTGFMQAGPDDRQ